MIRVQSEFEKQNGYYYEYEPESIPLGQGGMGIVYHGYCFQEGNRDEYIPVAIKKLTNTTPELLDKGRREASIQIEHDNLLLNYGFIENSLENEQPQAYYIIMESLQGISLDQVLSGNIVDKFGIECVFARELYEMYQNDKNEFTKFILQNVLPGVKALHDNGYIHRDLDPSNIMVTHDRRIKVVDFGISKKVDVTGPGGTLNGSIMGKIDYAAPEMVMGNVNKHNFTSDIYSLGITAYHLCVGALPFQGEDNKVVQDQINTPVPIENITDRVLRHIVGKSTQKEQNNRYHSIDEMLSDLQSLSKEDISKQYEEDFHKLNTYTSVERLRYFLSMYPEGSHTQEIKNMIAFKEEEATYQKVKDSKDVEVLRKYIETYPQGKHIGEIKIKLDKLEGKYFPNWLWYIAPVVGLATGLIISILVNGKI